MQNAAKAGDGRWDHCSSGCSPPWLWSRVSRKSRRRSVMPFHAGVRCCAIAKMLALRSVESRTGAVAVAFRWFWLGFRTATSVRLGMTLFPVLTPQTARADFPHPAFSRSIRPSPSTRWIVAPGRSRAQASRRDTYPGVSTQPRFVLCA